VVSLSGNEKSVKGGAGTKRGNYYILKRLALNLWGKDVREREMGTLGKRLSLDGKSDACRWRGGNNDKNLLR